MTAIEKILNLAKSEVGYIEKSSNKNLYDKITNAGSGNYTKYAYEMDTKYKGFYNGGKNGYAWCDCFFDWLFVNTFGVELAKKMLYQPSASAGAGCKYSMNYHKGAGKFFSSPKVGDQIFFYGSDEAIIAHTGLVCDVDDTYVYTIEGNTSSKSGVVSNGGMVCEKSYRLSEAKIAGYGRPDYASVETNSADEHDSLILEWQKAAMADGFVPPKYFPKYGSDGEWGVECEDVAKQAVVKRRDTYLYKNLTKLAQREIGMKETDIDGLCGEQTENCIVDYQNAKGLPVNGVIDLDDWKMMLLGVATNEEHIDTSIDDSKNEASEDISGKLDKETPTGEDVTTEGELEYIKTPEEAQNFLISLLNHIISFIIRLFKK